MEQNTDTTVHNTDTPAKTSTQSKVAATNGRSKRVSFVIVLSLLCFGFGFIGSSLANFLNDEANQVTKFISAKEDGNKVQTASEQSISAVVDKVSPSVVSIITNSEGVTGQAAGTGMFVSGDGYIMTNKHVVDGASSATVVTSSGKIFEKVKIVGTDPLNDVAFLRIANVSGLPAVTIGDSKTVRAGQSVVAIGNALGQFQNTVTSGIISGLGRPVLASGTGQLGSATESLSDLIQTDAAINSGNSGGPLLNMQGQVIGINTAVAQDAQSIGFAIPIGATKGILSNLLETGKVQRAIVGVQYISITPEVKSEYDLSVDRGDYVFSESGSAIRADSPAAKAEIKDRDIITKVNDQSVGAGKSVSTLIGEFRPGDKVTLTILRGSQTLTKTLTLESF